jgi:hypothetical protein
MNIETMPGDAEYHGAVAAMNETYGGRGVYLNGKLITTYAVGDRIKWQDEHGLIRRGVVIEVLTDTEYHVRSHMPDRGNEHFAVREADTLPL